MKKIILIFAAIIMIAGFSSKVMAQATENTAAAATIIAPITITETAALNFGTLAVLAATPGTCVLSTTGTRTPNGGVNLSAQAPTSSNAAYNVGGANNTTYAISFGAPSITVDDGGAPLHTMVVDNFLARTASAGANGLTGTLNGSGADAFTVGATLNVNNGQTPGTYTGTFDVTVAYN